MLDKLACSRPDCELPCCAFAARWLQSDFTCSLNRTLEDAENADLLYSTEISSTVCAYVRLVHTGFDVKCAEFPIFLRRQFMRLHRPSAHLCSTA